MESPHQDFVRRSTSIGVSYYHAKVLFFPVEDGFKTINISPSFFPTLSFSLNLMTIGEI